MRRWAARGTASIAIACAVAVPSVVAGGLGRADATPPPPVSTWTAVATGLQANAMAFDATRNKVLVAVPPTVPALGNDVVELDPSTGAIGRTLFVGAKPASLSVSSDGTTMYVSLGGGGRVLRVNLATFTVVSSFTILDDTNRQLFPRQVAVVPGNDDEVVVMSHLPNTYPDTGEFAVYNNGVKLPHYDAFFNTVVDTFAFGPTASTIYGYNDGKWGVSTWARDDQGVTLTHDAPKLIQGYSPEIKYAAGRLYASYGVVVDPTTDTQVGNAFAYGNAVDPVPSVQRIYYIAGGKLEEFRSDTFASVSSLTLNTTTPCCRPFYSDLISTNVGVAALLDDGSVYLAGPGIGPPSTVLPPTPPDHISNLKLQTVNQYISAVVNDPITGKLLVAMPAGALANQVAEIDPATGAIGRHVAVGNDPGVLGLSDDGSKLYVGLNGAPTVSVIDVGSFTKTGSFGLGGDPTFGHYYAGALAVAPGAPSTVAVVRIASRELGSGSVGGVAIYDSGVKRPAVAGSDATMEADSMHWAGGATLYASDVADGSATVYRMRVDAKGTHLVRSTDNGYGAVLDVIGSIAYMQYTVLDATTLDLLGVYPDEGLHGSDGANDRGYAFEPTTDTISEYQEQEMRFVKSAATTATASDRTVIPTSTGFALTDSLDVHTMQHIQLLVEQSLQVKVPWSANDNTRIGQIAAYLGIPPAQVQQVAVGVVAYLLALDHSTSTTPWTPTPPGTSASYTSTYNTAQLPALKSVERQFAVSDLDAHRVSVSILSYLLSLAGH